MVLVVRLYVFGFSWGGGIFMYCCMSHSFSVPNFVMGVARSW